MTKKKIESIKDACWIRYVNGSVFWRYAFDILNLYQKQE